MNPLRKYAYYTKWNIGFIEQSLDKITSEDTPLVIHWMKHNYKKGWFADPFILEVTETEIVLLVEELFYSTGLGRISRIVVDRDNYTLKNVALVLQLPTHLSFPAILRKNGRVFFYPENSASGELHLYEYYVKTNTCRKVETICKAPLTDAIITDIIENKPQIYSSQLPNPNGDILNLYDSNGLVLKQFRFNRKIARNAGDWFCHENKRYRPAQDCDIIYGKAVIIQEVKVEDNGNLSFIDVRRIESDNAEYNQGCHTFNFYQGISVVDAKGWQHPVAHAIYQFFYNIKNAIKGSI